MRSLTFLSALADKKSSMNLRFPLGRRIRIDLKKAKSLVERGKSVKHQRYLREWTQHKFLEILKFPLGWRQYRPLKNPLVEESLRNSLLGCPLYQSWSYRQTSLFG